jgi:polysaccharide pyruvyl transferase WcaK-like protein
VNVHISNFYGTRNKGDELMLRGLIGELRNIGAARISVSTLYNKEIDSGKFKDITFVDSLSTIETGIKSSALTLIAYVLIRMKLTKLFRILIRLKNLDSDMTFQSINNSDICITAGGPFLNENKRSLFGFIVYPTLNFIVPFTELVYAKGIGKPYGIIGQSASEISFRISKKEFNFVLKHAKFVAFRDSDSKKKVDKSLGVDHQIYVIPDLALSNKLWDLEFSENKRLNKLMINMRRLDTSMIDFMKRSKLEINSEIDYINYFVKLVDNINKKNSSLDFLFFTQAIEDDRIIAERLVSLSNLDSSNSVIIDDGISTQTALDLMSECMFGITTRYHSMIIAIILNIPFRFISYSEKVSSAIKDYGLQNFEISEKNSTFSESNFIECIDLEKEKKILQLIRQSAAMKLDLYFKSIQNTFFKE